MGTKIRQYTGLFLYSRRYIHAGTKLLVDIIDTGIYFERTTYFIHLLTDGDQVALNTVLPIPLTRNWTGLPTFISLKVFFISCQAKQGADLSMTSQSASPGWMYLPIFIATSLI